jgi:hypothetical protein
MPIGFVGVVEKSNAQVRDGIRYVHHVYEGRADLVDVVDFYRRSLPLNDWEPIDEQAERAETTLRFVKGPESLGVQVSRKTGTIVTVMVSMGARNQQSSLPMPSLYLGGAG